MKKETKQVADVETGEVLNFPIWVTEETTRVLNRTQRNSRFFPKQYEVNTQPSMTVPNQTLPMKTILERYARGLPIEGTVKTPVYDLDMPDIRNLDIEERAQLALQLADHVKSLQAQLKAEQEAKTPSVVPEPQKETNGQEKP